jgi:hypothetical protein
MDVRADNSSILPTIALLELSLSQKFQFLYQSNCAKIGTPYNHEVTRYFHTMLRSANSVIDISQIPLDLTGTLGEPALCSVLASLKTLGFATGLVCRNIYSPNIFKELSTFMKDHHSLHFIHLENCGAIGGLPELANTMRWHRQSDVGYWNLSGNDLSGAINAFLSLLQRSKSGIFYLDRKSVV